MIKDKSTSISRKGKIGQNYESFDSQNIRFLYLNVRNKSYIVRPIKKIYSTRPGTSQSIGPGSYNPREQLRVQSHEFSDLPRFDKDRLELMIKKPVSRNKFTSIPKSDSTSNIQIKKSKSPNHAKVIKIKADIVKATKFNLDSLNKEVRETKLKEKYQRLEYRSRLAELAKIKKSWLSLFCIFGVSYSIACYVTNRIKLRRRICRQIGKLRMIILSIGKVLYRLRRNRKRKAIRSLKIFLLPHIKRWLDKKRIFYCKLILGSIDKTFTSSILFAASAKWHERIIRIQRTLRFLLFIRRKLYHKLINLWDKTEPLFFKKTYSKLKKTKKAESKQENLKISTIPEEIKKYFLLQLIKQKYSSYLEQCKNFSVACSAIDELNKSRDFDINANLVKKIKYPSKPKKIWLLQQIQQEEILSLIKEAERQRSYWSEITLKLTSKLRNSLKIISRRKRSKA